MKGLWILLIKKSTRDEANHDSNIKNMTPTVDV